MPYATTNPPSLLVQGTQNRVPARWVLTGTDAAATVRVTGYITNALALGMKVNDLVEYTDTNLNIVSDMRVAALNANGSADLADATTVGVATNSD